MIPEASKKRAPAFQFYADDFIGGTFTMNNEEKGAYITLLCIQWTKGFVTKHEFDRIAVGMPPHSQAICQAKFQTDADGNMRNSRMESERSKQAEYRVKQAENAKKRWVGNATAMPPHSQADAVALPAGMPNGCSPSPSPSPSVDMAPPARLPESPKQPRKRNPLFDTLASVCGLNPESMTKSEGGKVGTSLADIRTADPNVTEDEIRRRAANYRKEWPGVELTPTALSGNWTRMAGVKPATASQSNGKPLSAEERWARAEMAKIEAQKRA